MLLNGAIALTKAAVELPAVTTMRLFAATLPAQRVGWRDGLKMNLVPITVALIGELALGRLTHAE